MRSQDQCEANHRGVEGKREMKRRDLAAGQNEIAIGMSPTPQIGVARIVRAELKTSTIYVPARSWSR